MNYGRTLPVTGMAMIGVGGVAAHWDGTDSALHDVLVIADQPTNWTEYTDHTINLMPANGTMVVLHRCEWLVRYEDGRFVAVDQDKLERQFEPLVRLASVAS